MGNSRVKERFELAMDAKQVIAVLVGSLVILGGVFVLGITVGRQQSPPPAAATTIAAPKDALARLDEPIASHEEPAPELKAHQALTDTRSMDKSLPVPSPKTTTVAITAPPPGPVTPAATDPVIQAPPAPAPAPAAEAAAQPPAPAVAAGVDTAKQAPAASPKPAHAPHSNAPFAKKLAAKAKPASNQAHAAAGAKRAYTIQVASVAHRADAERLAKKLSSRHPRIVSADVPGKGRYYRVLVGSYDSADAAKRQAASLTRSGVHGIVTAMR